MISIKTILVTTTILCTTVLYADTSPIEALENAERAVQNLSINPADTETLNKLPTIGDLTSNQTVKIALTTIYGLGYLSLGQLDNADKAKRFLTSIVPTSPSILTLSLENYQQPCPTCNGSRIAAYPCTACDSRSKCTRCAGRGSFPRISGGAETCIRCNGTGKCQDCSGEGKVNRSCKNCDGKGAVFAKSLAADAYKKLLAITRPMLQDTTRSAKGLILFEGREITPAQRDTELALQQAATIAAAEHRQTEERRLEAEAAAAATLKLQQDAETRNRAALQQRAQEEAMREQKRLQKEKDDRNRRLREQEEAARRESDNRRKRSEATKAAILGIATSVLVVVFVVCGYALALLLGARVADACRVRYRTALLASGTGLTAAAIVFVCCIPLLQYAFVVTLIIGFITTGFVVKTFFAITWEKAVLTCLMATVGTTVCTMGLGLLITYLQLSCTLLELVKK